MARSANKEKRIGILGGTFNPIHNGHLNLARSAKKKLSLDKVILVPSYIPPHKKIIDHISIRDRLNMVKIAIKKYRRFSVSLYEIKRRKKSYSIDTIRYFKRRLGKKTKLFFLIGADSLIGIQSWRNVKKLFRLVQFVVAPRAGYSFKGCPNNIIKINIPLKDISSTEIRNLIKHHKSARKLLPQGVNGYIRKKKLYIVF